ncbi:coagulation factor V-like, partial [Actinia tenebrosa]|uniref:Coagulation factor V-like n=1 Tax=Actinia tenebrosa TaxID=6105 RepID=A0A6P8HSY6_ACTTE
MKVNEIAIQGRQAYNNFVKSFYVRYSSDEVHWSYQKETNKIKTFPANRNMYSTVTIAMNPPVLARYVRVYPRGWHSRICMRTEFYGCEADRCEIPLGVQDGRVLRNMMHASSYHPSTSYRPWKARLHSSSGSWYSGIRNTRQWLQIDLGVISYVRRIATQGAYNGNSWVKKYIVSYSVKGFRFIPYKEGQRIRMFFANTDRYQVTLNRLLKPIKARHVRIHPKSWQSYIALRVELYGCRLGKICNQPLGLRSGRIPSSRISASSKYNQFGKASRGRLHSRARGRYYGSWIAKFNNRYQWLQ